VTDLAADDRPTTPTPAAPSPPEAEVPVGLPRAGGPDQATAATGRGPRAAGEVTDDELAARNAEFESLPPAKIIQWAVDNFAPHLALTASMTDAVLIDLAVRVDPAVEVVFIDTGYHFPETLETVERVRRHYGLNLRILTVAHHDEELWKVDPENCCSAVKVGQLDRALAGKAAWMSGLRRAEADSRVDAPIVSRDLRGLVKVNPIATWSDQDVAGYLADHDVIVNPLLEQGYTSIGCQPCTVRPVDPADPRSGRWAGRSRQECGIHDL
jgi:phosphoadenosine phosphosulfate reductase